MIEPEGKVYLQHSYVIGPEAGECDYVGPFETQDAALAHRDEFGPVDSRVHIFFHFKPIRAVSPEEHVAYVTSRV